VPSLYASKEKSMTSGEGSQSLLDFLMGIADHPDQVSAFRNDPRTVLAASGLSSGDQQLILDGDLRKVQEAVAGTADIQGYGGGGFLMGIVEVVTHPRPEPPRPQ
jgi:hypothetical protein